VSGGEEVGIEVLNRRGGHNAPSPCSGKKDIEGVEKNRFLKKEYLPRVTVGEKGESLKVSRVSYHEGGRNEKLGGGREKMSRLLMAKDNGTENGA